LREKRNGGSIFRLSPDNLPRVVDLVREQQIGEDQRRDVFELELPNVFLEQARW
jgi:hypothetical protein